MSPRHQPTWWARVARDREHEGACRGGGGEGAEPESDQRPQPPQAEGDAEHHGEHADPHRDGEAPPEHVGADLAPAQRGSHGHEEEEGQADGHGDRVEEGRADIDLLLRHGLVEQRVERPQQDDEGEADEEQVVQQEGALPAERRVDPPGERRRSPRQAMRPKPTMTTTKKKAIRVGPSVDSREGVHRLDHAGAGQEGAQDGEGERGDGERQVPDAHEPAALLHEHRVQVRRPAQPGQQRGVLHRVPSPEAAPAEHLVGPPRTQHDADGEEGEGHQRPAAALDLPAIAIRPVASMPMAKANGTVNPTKPM